MAATRSISSLVANHRERTQKKLTIFFCLTFVISWSFFVPLAFSQAGTGWIHLRLSIPIMTVLGTLGPSIAALLTVRWTTGLWPAIHRVSWPKRWFLVVLLSPILICLVFAVFPALLLSSESARQLHWYALASLNVFNYSTIIGGPLGEEPGWRGFALPHLQDVLPPWLASLILGVTWACWHLPLFLCRSWSSSSFPQYALIVVGLSFIMTFLFNLSGQSTILAILVHAMFNTSSRWLAALLGDSSLRPGRSPELVLGLCGLVGGVLLSVLTRGQLAKHITTRCCPRSVVVDTLNAGDDRSRVR